jgi:hypothetical protein
MITITTNEGLLHAWYIWSIVVCVFYCAACMYIVPWIVLVLAAAAAAAVMCRQVNWGSPSKAACRERRGGKAGACL